MKVEVDESKHVHEAIAPRRTASGGPIEVKERGDVGMVHVKPEGVKGPKRFQ